MAHDALRARSSMRRGRATVSTASKTRGIPLKTQASLLGDSYVACGDCEVDHRPGVVRFISRCGP